MSFTSRPIVMSEGGMVVSGHHRASEAGAAVLRRGGNAFDAAIAAAATLAVAIPNMNGLGGDAIALCYEAKSGSVFAINGSGRSPAKATVEAFREQGLASIPQRGALAISVCGVVHAWQSVLERFGSISLSEAVAPAIDLAERGTPVDLVLQHFFSSQTYCELARTFPALEARFGPHGMRHLGSRLKQPELAATLRVLARDGIQALYGGPLGAALVKDIKASGGLLELSDLADHSTEITQALSVGFHGRELFVAPPNSQGVALAYLAGLWEARKRTGVSDFSTSEFLKLKMIAFSQRDKLATDPERSSLKPGRLDEALFDTLIKSTGSADVEARAGGGDTSTLVVVDREGNAVSWVQSLFEDFGSGVISPSTGIVLHNRLYLEQISEDPVRGLRARTRPFHTLCPALLIGQGCELTIATPGDHGQPQAIFQVLPEFLEKEENLQSAIEAPRIRHDTGEKVMVESRNPSAVREAIEAAGYVPEDVGDWSRLMGGVNAIQRSDHGLLFGGADPRRSCYAVCE